MTIDSDGFLWVALWGGSRVVRVDSRTGSLVHQVLLPATQVSSCAFGGERLDTLYITTSRAGLSDEDLQMQPLAGAVFAFTGTSARGQEANNKVRLE